MAGEGEPRRFRRLRATPVHKPGNLPEIAEREVPMPSALSRPGADLTQTPSIPLAFIILGHGSRDSAANDDFVRCVDAWRASREDGALVAHAYVELARPSLADALESIARRAAEVVVVPLFLFSAGHVKNDVPLALARARALFPGVRFVSAPPLGVHPELAKLVFERAASVAPMDGGKATRTAMVVVGRGSSDPDANADFCKIARLAGEGRGLLLVEPAFVGITRPLFADALEHVARARPDRIVVVPYLLFPGRLVEKLRAQVSQFADRYPGTRPVLAPTLGADACVLALMGKRAEGARLGQAPLPCDTCLYREKFPGFVNEVGGLRALLFSVRHMLTHTQATPHVHAHRPLKKHVLVCASADCADRGGLAVLDALRRAVRRAGVQREVRVTKTSCMGRCGEGPTLVVYPDGVWYRSVRADDADDIVGEHILGDRLVARIVDHVMQ
jgi:sirohydrochlorin ferrochelatase/(2Fe-2S) ferredoxin